MGTVLRMTNNNGESWQTKWMQLFSVFPWFAVVGTSWPRHVLYSERIRTLNGLKFPTFFSSGKKEIFDEILCICMISMGSGWDMASTFLWVDQNSKRFKIPEKKYSIRSCAFAWYQWCWDMAKACTFLWVDQNSNLKFKKRNIPSCAFAWYQWGVETARFDGAAWN